MTSGLLLFGGGGVASACDDVEFGQIECEDVQPPGTPDLPPMVPGEPLPPLPPPEGYYAAVLEAGADCWYMRFYHAPGFVLGEDTWDWAEWQEHNEEIDREMCPGADEDPIAADIGEYLAAYWSGAVSVPAVDLRLDPGFALPGLRTYLEIDGSEGFAETLEAPAPFDQTVTLTFAREFVVDWGDGSAPVTTTSAGVPYPGGDGEISHVYTDAGSPAVTVTAVWTGSWDAGPLGAGEFATTQERSADLEVPVRERRAVRVR